MHCAGVRATALPGIKQQGRERLAPLEREREWGEEQREREGEKGMFTSVQSLFPTRASSISLKVLVAV